MNKKLINKRFDYYNQKVIQWQLLNSMKNREVVLMNRQENWKCQRVFKFNHTDFMIDAFKYYKVFEEDVNIYVSLAKYKELPVFPLTMIDRSKKTSEWFLSSSEKIYDYDIFLDFDINDIKKLPDMIKEIGRFLELLNFNWVCYRILPSGTGYQIIVSNGVYQYNEVYNIVKHFKDMMLSKYLDIKGVGVHNKIRKCEYSLVGDKIVLPLHLVDFNGYSYDDFECNRVLKNVTIYNRGLCDTNYLGMEENKQNLRKFVKKYNLL